MFTPGQLLFPYSVVLSEQCVLSSQSQLLYLSFWRASAHASQPRSVESADDYVKKIKVKSDVVLRNSVFLKVSNQMYWYITAFHVEDT